MASLWADNPDYYDLSFIEQVWSSLVATTFSGLGYSAFSVDSGTGRRSGSNSLKFAQMNGVDAAFNELLLTKSLTAGSATFIIQFGIIFDSFYNVEDEIPFFLLGDATVWHIGLAMRNDFTLIFKRGMSAGSTAGTTLAIASKPLVVGTYYSFSIKCTVDNSAGALSFKLNRVEQLNGGVGYTSINTQNGGSAGWSRFAFCQGKAVGSGQPPAYRISDVYVCDDTGGVNDDHPGDVYVIAQQAQAGDGANTDWTPSTGSDHGAMVDDAVPDEDSTYNEGTASSQRDTYVFPNLPVTIGTPRAVINRMRLRLTDPGSQDVKDVVRISGVNYDGSLAQSPTAPDYAYYDYPHEVNPATSGAWSISVINAAELGPKVA